MKYITNYIENLSKIGEFPNIETPTTSGDVFWDTIDLIDSWKIQVNVFTKHATIQYGSMENFLKGADDYFILYFNEIDKEINKVKCNNDFF